MPPFNAQGYIATEAIYTGYMTVTTNRFVKTCGFQCPSNRTDHSGGLLIVFPRFVCQASLTIQLNKEKVMTRLY